MKIVDIKTKIIPSNPRSKNYPIGYSGGIASNSNGVTPDLSIYLLKEIWERNIEERTDESGNEYLYIRKPLAIGGGATMYASNGVVVPSIFDGLPLDNTTIRKNPETGLIEVIGGTGTSFDENAMWSALSGSSDNQINKSHLTTALDGYATQNWVIENYATKSELSAVSNKLNDFLDGSDTDTIINKWKELEAFLSGMAETDNLAEILETKADKKYVDSTFVTLATKQTITGEKTFSSVLNTAAIKASGAITAPSLAVSDWVTIAGIKLRKLEDGALMLEGNLAVTGGITTYAIDPVSASTIMDGVVVDGTTIKKENGKLVAVGGGEAGNVAWGNISGKPSVFATNIANITDLHSSWDAVLAAQKPAWLTAVSIATISDLHANWDALLKAAPSAYVTRWPTISEVTGKQNLIVKLNGGTTEGTNQFTYNATGAKTINITPAGIGAYTKSESDSKYPTKTGSGASGTWGINVTGNAGTATKLQTARSLWGNNFDGTANISGDITLAIGKGIYLSANDERWLLQTKRSDNTQINGIKTNGFQMCTYFGNKKTMQFSNDRIYSYVDFRAEKDLYINGIRLHKSADGVITLEGNLAVTGGVTMYAIDPVSASTVMDGVAVDGTTIAKVDGVLKVLNAGGGEAGSVAWGNITGKPSVFATNIANITDLHSSWDAVLKAQKPNWLTAVSIATISDLHANWDALLKAAPSAYVTRWPTISEVTNKQSLIVKLNGGTTEGTNQFTYNATAAKTINITASSVGAAASSHNHSWSNITSGKPTTLAGYGITDAPTKTGSGASGTWGINISGNASNADKIDNAHNGDLTARYLNTISNTSDLSSFKYNGISAWITNSSNRPADYGVLFQFSSVGNPSPGTNGHWVNQIAYGTNARLYTRQRINTAGWTTWKIIAFLDDNVVSATKLQTPRQLWGNDFDGTAPVNGRIYASNGIYLPYGSDINNEYGNVLRTNYDSSTGGDYFELTAIGANKRKVSLIGLNYGELRWEGSRFVLGAYGGGWYMDNSDWIKSQNNKGIYTGGNILSGGGCTFYGSDIRYKYIVQHVQLLSLNKIAEAPSFVYRWNRPNMNQSRLNLGGSAQYTQSILPWAVEENDNFLSMDYATVAYTFAVHTARHLLTYETRTDKKIKKLENRVKYLEKQLKKLGYEEVRTLDDQSV